MKKYLFGLLIVFLLTTMSRAKGVTTDGRLPAEGKQSAEIAPPYDSILGQSRSAPCLAAPNPPSLESLEWTKYPGNPVLNGGAVGSWDSVVSNPSVLFRNGQYEMWYTGASVTYFSDSLIGYASSLDGINWTRSISNPLSLKGNPGTWDGAIVLAPFVLFDDGVYKMWYRGQSNSANLTTGRIGYAESQDGIHWTKYVDNPVIGVGPSGSWDSDNIFSASVIVQENVFKLWYSACAATVCQIGYATSSNGTDWTKHAANPVFPTGATGSWDSGKVYYPTVIFNGSTYEMWYSGTNGSTYGIGYATSTDGISWNKDAGNPVLIPEASGWDSYLVLVPTVLHQKGAYQMWYGGRDGNQLSRIGYATKNAKNINLPVIVKK